MKVHLRQRKQTTKGSISLYLEYYKGAKELPDGKIKVLRDYEYLNLYLIDNPKTTSEKQSNKETLELAKAIKSKREVEIKNGMFGFEMKKRTKVDFLDFVKNEIEKKKNQSIAVIVFISFNNHLMEFVKQEFKDSSISGNEVTTEFCNGFKNYLLNTAKKKNGENLNKSSAKLYFSKFIYCIGRAKEEKIISSDLVIDKKFDIGKNRILKYLTFDELKKIAKTYCKYDIYKRAFLFSCLTGLRVSDIRNMKWAQLKYDSQAGWMYTFIQQKTDSVQYLPISDQAIVYCGEVGQPNQKVFPNVCISSYHNNEKDKWMLRAGIDKKITFHSARHTFATLQLSFNTDLTTVSELLGHQNIKATQIYAKVIDESKRKAVNIIPDINL